MNASILIVEDEPAIMDNICYALETEGFLTRRQTTGNPVLELINREEVDLIILDIGLPDISGIELCKLIRKRSDVPIIFLTARVDEVDRVVGLEIGADDYVTKPFSPRELTARVKAVLRRTGKWNRHSNPRKTSSFQIDEDRRRITCLGEVLELSHHEFEILKNLVRLPGHVFSRDRLMELAWEDPAASMNRTVDAHVKNIRSKIRRIRLDFDPIVTHRGFGYALKEDA